MKEKIEIGAENLGGIANSLRTISLSFLPPRVLHISKKTITTSA